jgi:predicted Ser/Thr protein kinase
MPSTKRNLLFNEEFPELASALAGQFRVERELGRGGMGVVYLAVDERLDRLIALKVLPATHATDSTTVERFLREARTAARLAHPNVVPVYHAGEVGGTAYFTMAFVEGESLADRVRDRGPLPAVDAVPILRDVAWALAYAHARGVVHRDVKPENILLERSTRRTLVTDFGIAYHAPINEDAARLTADGHVLGTVHYMSPEQVTGHELDGRSDLYALGVVAYEVLSGHLPFEGLGPAAVLVAHATRPAPPLRDVTPNVPAGLALVVDRCLAKNPDDRYATGEAMAEALERALEQTVSAEPVGGSAMLSGLPDRLDETQAVAIWRRAAQLQADALHRLEETKLSLRRVSDARDVGGPGSDRAADVTAGYRITDVAEAAAEAGISRQYVAMALAELPRGAQTAAATMGVSEDEAARYLGTDVRSVGVTVEVPATPGRTLQALGIVLPQSPYDLQLRETVGGHPLDGGVLVFDLPSKSLYAASAGAPITIYWMGTRHQLLAHQVQVTLRPAPGGGPGEPEHTAVTMTADLRPGVRKNVRWSQWGAGVLGSGGGFLAGAILANGPAIAASLAVLGPAVGIGAAIAGLSLLGYRKLYSSTVAKAEREMRQALEAVASALRSAEVFGTLPASRLDPDASLYGRAPAPADARSASSLPRRGFEHH